MTSHNDDDDSQVDKVDGVSKKQKRLSIETMVVGLYPPTNDPYGATSMPIYQSATFQQPTATTFGQYDYTRSGNTTVLSSSAKSLSSS